MKMKQISTLIFRAVALGLSVAVVTLLSLHKIDVETSLMMISLSVGCLAIGSLSDTQLPEKKN